MKIVILDYTTGAVYVCGIDRDQDTEEFMQELHANGEISNPSQCHYMVTEEFKITIK